ncbi:hypothetical protein F5884DRAFT_34101 [Xylogone sp. PMI_703]|nr:hypothetical protein F5884DRAFT_34101 [Xylogone sp. PMI_703]
MLRWQEGVREGRLLGQLRPVSQARWGRLARRARLQPSRAASPLAFFVHRRAAASNQTKTHTSQSPVPFRNKQPTAATEKTHDRGSGLSIATLRHVTMLLSAEEPWGRPTPAQSQRKPKEKKKEVTEKATPKSTTTRPSAYSPLMKSPRAARQTQQSSTRRRRPPETLRPASRPVRLRSGRVQTMDDYDFSSCVFS